MGLMDNLKGLAKQAQEKLKGKPAEVPPAPAKAEWYYTTDGRTKMGPVTTEQLRQMAESGALLPTAMVMKEGMPRWLPASSVKGLFQGTAAAPPPPPIPGVATAPPPIPGVAAPPAPVPASPAQQTPSPSKPRPLTPPEPGVIAEVEVVYQGGHASLLDVVVGQLRLGANGLSFVSVDPPQTLAIPYKKIIDIREPRRGEYPREVVQQTQALKAGAKALGFASSLLGKASGLVSDDGEGQVGMAVLSAAGSMGASALEQSAQLGGTPRNRLFVVVLERGVRHRLCFDVAGKASREELESKASAFWRQTAQVRSRFAKRRRGGTRKGSYLRALRGLKKLLDEGVLSRAEFDHQKAGILAEMSSGQKPLPAR